MKIMIIVFCFFAFCSQAYAVGSNDLPEESMQNGRIYNPYGSDPGPASDRYQTSEMTDDVYSNAQQSSSVTYNQYGDNTVGSNGSSFYRMGNVTVGSDGKTYSHVGSAMVGSDGTTYSSYGNVTQGSDGSTYTNYGNTSVRTGSGQINSGKPSWES